MNLVLLTGRLADKPTLRYTANKKVPVTTLRLATKDVNKETTWHNVTVWSDQAELCCKWLEKGSRVSVNGRIEYRDICVDEKNIPVPELVANHVEFL